MNNNDLPHYADKVVFVSRDEANALVDNDLFFYIRKDPE